MKQTESRKSKSNNTKIPRISDYLSMRPFLSVLFILLFVHIKSDLMGDRWIKQLVSNIAMNSTKSLMGWKYHIWAKNIQKRRDNAKQPLTKQTIFYKCCEYYDPDN